MGRDLIRVTGAPALTTQPHLAESGPCAVAPWFRPMRRVSQPAQNGSPGGSNPFTIPTLPLSRMDWKLCAVRDNA